MNKTVLVGVVGFIMPFLIYWISGGDLVRNPSLGFVATLSFVLPIIFVAAYKDIYE